MLFWCFFILFVVLCFAKYKSVGIDSPIPHKYVGYIFILFICAFRFDVGWDYPGYYMCIYDKEALGKLEPLDRLVYYVADIFNYPPLVFIIFSVITLSLVFYSLERYTNNIQIAVLVYLAFFIDTVLGTIRQGVAVAIVLYCYKYMVNGQFIKYFIGVVIASLFHSSAIVALLIFFIYRSFNLKLTILFCALTPIVFLAIVKILSALSLYGAYIGNTEDYSGGNLIKYVNLFLSILMLIMGRNLNKYRFFPLIYVIIIGNVFPVIFGGHIGNRVAFYFLVFECIFIPNVINKYNKSIKNVTVAMLCCYFLALMYISDKNPIKTPNTPYRTIFSIDYKNPKFK